MFPEMLCYAALCAYLFQRFYHASVYSWIVKPHMGFFVSTGLCLAVLSHIFCARYSMFAAKLLTHMMAASLGTQVGERWDFPLSCDVHVSSSVILGLNV